jgi:hypothetical protein
VVPKDEPFGWDQTRAINEFVIAVARAELTGEIPRYLELDISRDVKHAINIAEKLMMKAVKDFWQKKYGHLEATWQEATQEFEAAKETA